MADALDSKSSDRKIVWVQVPPPALLFLGRDRFYKNLRSRLPRANITFGSLRKLAAIWVCGWKSTMMPRICRREWRNAFAGRETPWPDKSRTPAGRPQATTKKIACGRDCEMSD